MTTTERDPRTLPPAPPDEWWHRAAERIDSAYDAARAIAEEYREAARRAAGAAGRGGDGERGEEGRAA